MRNASQIQLSPLFPERSVHSPRVHRILLCLAAILSLSAHALEWTLLSYNVENLFDADGVAIYDDYKPAKYTPEHLAVKVANIARVLSRVDEGRGPDVAVFNEVELDQTPGSAGKDARAWLESVKNRKLSDLLKESPLPETITGLPAEAFLLKACEEEGLLGYQVATTDEEPGAYEDGRPKAVRNVVFSRFPIKGVRTIPTANARAILEVTLDVDGNPLTVFANHWKSGAGDADNELARIDNAKTLRARLDEIFAKDPNADVIVAGDLNSHYNQNRRYRQMKDTGINDILGSQGNELALRSKTADLYNLWFELPSNNRGSDIYKEEWGTLMNLILSRGLYDQNGVQYVDNSFSVVKIPALNADVFGRPVRWSKSSAPGGFSDHFPVMAGFRTVEEGKKDRWMPLNQPSLVATGPGTPVRVDTSLVDLFDSAVQADKLPPGTDLRDGSFDGRVFLVEAPASVDAKGYVHVQLLGKDYDIYTHNQDLRPVIRERAQKDSKLGFYGELCTYRGRWQFLIHGKEWLVPPPGSVPHL